MKSTNHNLNNPMIVDSLSLGNERLISSHLKGVSISQEEYNLVQIKDPTVVYFINNSKDQRIYIGDYLVSKQGRKKMYLLGPSDEYGEYIIYLSEIIKSNNPLGQNGYLIEICRFKNPQQAITTLNLFNRVGSHHTLNSQIYQIIHKYIIRDIPLHDTLIGIMSLFGYRNDIRLQEVMHRMSYYNEWMREQRSILEQSIPRAELKMLRSNDNYLFRIYIDLYDLIVKHYNYFADGKFQKCLDLDLSEVIQRIFNIIETS